MSSLTLVGRVLRNRARGGIKILRHLRFNSFTDRSFQPPSNFDSFPITGKLGGSVWVIRDTSNSCSNEPGIYASIEAWRRFDGIICRIQSCTRRFRRILCTIHPLRHRIFPRDVFRPVTDRRIFVLLFLYDSKLLTLTSAPTSFLSQLALQIIYSISVAVQLLLTSE